MFYFDEEKEKTMDKVNFCNMCQLERINNRAEGCFVCINCGDREFVYFFFVFCCCFLFCFVLFFCFFFCFFFFPAVNYRDMPNGRICQCSYKRINHLKVRLRRHFQAVESENVPENVYDIIKKDLLKRRIRWDGTL